MADDAAMFLSIFKCHAVRGVCMTEEDSTKTIRVYETDKERIKDIADSTGRNIPDVVADIIREPDYVCPECGDPFSAGEIDASTVEEHGALWTDAGSLMKGQRDVKSFECPCCEARLKPEDVGVAKGGLSGGATREDLGVTSEDSAEFESVDESEEQG